MFVRGCEKFVPALAYLFCLALPGSCLVRFAYFLADLCRTVIKTKLIHQFTNQTKRFASATSSSSSATCVSPTTVKQETATLRSTEEGTKKKPGKILIQQSVECSLSLSLSSAPPPTQYIRHIETQPSSSGKLIYFFIANVKRQPKFQAQLPVNNEVPPVTQYSGTVSGT